MTTRNIPFHAMSVEETLSRLKTCQETGLKSDEIDKLREEHGFNELPPEEKESLWLKIYEQFDDPMVKILLVAAAISFLISVFSPTSEDDLPSWIEPLVIFLILIANGFIGIYQDFGAERSLEMLKKMESANCEVLRNSKWEIIAAKALLPGDIIRLKTGDSIPADGRVVKLVTGDVQINQAFLTGESNTVDKCLEKVELDSDNLAKKNMVFSGSLLEIGTIICVVTSIGESAELGKIKEEYEKAKEDTKDDTTLLKEQLDNFGDMLTKYIAIICLIIWVFNFNKFFDPVHKGFIGGALYYFKTAVALGVAAIPEGLPAVITTCLALGTRRMIKQNALVRKLSKVETLGCTTVICTDKTGTLTQNQMFAKQFFLIDTRDVLEMKEVDGVSYDFTKGGVIQLDRLSPVKELIQNIHITLIKNTQTRLIAEEVKGVKDLTSATQQNLIRTKCLGAPTEGALLCLGKKLQRQFNLESNLKGQEMLWCVPFTSSRKCMSVLMKSEDQKRTLYVKGAADIIIGKSTRFMNCKGEIKKMTAEKRDEFLNDMMICANQGFRVLALAFKPHEEMGMLQNFNGADDITHEGCRYLKDKKNHAEFESELVLTCVIGIQDPVKPECLQAIKIAKKAGINVMMITGDFTETAVAIAEELEMLQDLNKYKRSRSFVNEPSYKNVYSGKEWEAIKNEDQIKILKKAMKDQQSLVFSRTKPESKRLLVKQLKQLDEVVAMTGDGVNDASALKQASIGISMGLNGTDVAKEASDLVLLDDNFNTIVKAIEEGRSIYSNMKAFIRYMISSNIGEVFSIFFTCLIGIPEGFNSLQLLWVNLVTDGLPATALSFNKSDAEAMLKKPRRRGEKIVDNWILMRYLVVGLYVGFATTGIFVYCYTSYTWTNENHSLTSFWQLRNWGTCEKWIQDQTFTGYESDPCNYFSDGKKKASTLSLTVLVVIEMLNSLNALSENRSLLEVGVFSNIWLHMAIMVSIGIHCIMLYVPWFSKIFATVPLGINDWLLVIAFSFPVILIEEFLKFISRKKANLIKGVSSEKIKQE